MRRGTLLVGVLAVLVLAVPIILAPLSSSQAQLAPAEAVWAGFDPRSEPLEIEVLRKWNQGGSNFTEVYFTGMASEGNKVRVYAVYSAPENGRNLPGILHIHGGGQTVNEQWLKFWNQRGYAALSFNWGGKWPDRDKYTLWGKLTQGNHLEAKEMERTTQPSVRASSWYLWTRVSRRALTVLERQPEVDADRLGIFGVSMGGTIVWSFAATDARVKAACAIYGVGWYTYPDELDSPDAAADNPQMIKWRQSMEPEAYAERVKVPILFLDATNDFYGKMDWAYRTLSRTPAEHRFAFTPRYSHHVAPDQADNLPLWMDTWLEKGPAWPKNPVAQVALGRDGVPVLRVRPDESKLIAGVDLFYALDNRNPKTRFWRSVQSHKEGGKWAAGLPILDPSMRLYAFANVRYRSGVSLSSNLVQLIPASLGKARATDQSSVVFGDFSAGLDGWVTNTPDTDPVPPFRVRLKTIAGPDGRSGITVSDRIAIQTNKISDPKWRGPDGARLQFLAFSAVKAEAKLLLQVRGTNGQSREYAAAIQLSSGNGWQAVSLASSDFRTKEGEPLSNWRLADQLVIQPTASDPQPTYATFKWKP